MHFIHEIPETIGRLIRRVNILQSFHLPFYLISKVAMWIGSADEVKIGRKQSSFEISINDDFLQKPKTRSSVHFIQEDQNLASVLLQFREKFLDTRIKK